MMTRLLSLKEDEIENFAFRRISIFSFFKTSDKFVNYVELRNIFQTVKSSKNASGLLKHCNLQGYDLEIIEN